MDPVPYEQLAAEMQTGDVVLMHGYFRFSKAFEKFQGSKWDHVGTVIRPQDIGVDYEGVLFWESNDQPLRDVLFGTSKPGPMLVPLHDRMVAASRQTSMEYALRHLDVARTSEVFTRIRAFMDMAHGAHFPNEVALFGNLLLGRYLKHRTSPDDLGCSETTVMTFQAAGWIPSDCIPNAYDPKDFSAEGTLPLVDASFGPEIPVAPPAS